MPRLGAHSWSHRGNSKGSPYVHRSVQHTRDKLVVVSTGQVRSPIYPEGIRLPMKKPPNPAICLFPLVHILFQP